MSTSYKIYLLIAFLLIVLAVNTLVSLNQIFEFAQQIRPIIQGDAVNTINQIEFETQQAVWISFWISFFLTCLAAAIVIFKVAIPLKKLHHNAKTIRKHFNDDVPLSFDDINGVVRAFELMSGRVNSLEDQLNDLKNKIQDNLRIAHEQKTDLEKVNKELDDFVYTMSHDIRAPLTGIAGYADYLKKHIYETLDSRAKRSVDGIVKSAARLNQLINDILEVTRITRVKNPYEPTDFNQLVTSVLERLEYDIERYNVDISVQNDLPVLICDKIKMTGVFVNLINNAIKFSSKVTGQRPRVEIGYHDYPAYVEFFVRDNGIGIPEHLQGEIFELFKRAHSAEEYEGTGTGLSIVKASVEDQGGKIWVNSTPGQGAAFHFTVPKTLTKTSD